MTIPSFGLVQNTHRRSERSTNARVARRSNNAINLTACGSFSLAHGNSDGGARVYEVEPPAAGYGGR
jgi:hypothetical protein